MHRKGKKIAVVCNYQIKENRIGSMDRFFLAFNSACKKKGFSIDWYFPKSKKIELYKDFELFTDQKSNVEALFFNQITKSNKDYDFVFTHFVEFYTPFYKKLKKIISSEVIAVDHMSRPLNGFSFKKKIKRKIKYIFNRKHIDKIVAVSQYIKNQNLKDYSRFLKNKIEVIYNGIDIELYNYSNKTSPKESDKFKFIVVSHLVHEKGIQDLIGALKKFDKELLKKIKIDIYGEGVYKKELLKLVVKYSLEDVIYFKGSIHNVYNMYKNYDFMIQPTYMEAFSLSILESLCSNVPVITTKVGGNTEIIEYGINGFLFTPKNIKELRDIIIKVCNGSLTLEKDEFYSKIHENYTLENMVNNYLKLL